MGNRSDAAWFRRPRRGPHEGRDVIQRPRVIRPRGVGLQYIHTHTHTHTHIYIYIYIYIYITGLLDPVALAYIIHTFELYV